MNRDLEEQGAKEKEVLMRLHRHGYLWIREEGYFGGASGWGITKNSGKRVWEEFNSIEAVAEWVDRNLPK